ncbi:hypothetical protein ABKA04_004254 [Annulohypoxylon sp. FPYF3050]
MASPQQNIETQDMDSNPDPNSPNSSQADVAPPAYDNPHARLRNSTQPAPPATNGKFYFENQTEETIEIGICPDIPGTPRALQWYARLKFKCDNVPQLMREGLYWSLDNVQWEDGYINTHGLPEPNNEDDKEMNDYVLYKGLKYTRNYFLRDLQVPSRWVARFQIHAPTLKTLGDMRLENLSMEDIHYVRAWSSGRKGLIYGYEAKHPQNSYNVIYDDMPMEGWWVWPKKLKF